MKYSVNFKVNGKIKHIEFKSFEDAKSEAVKMSKDGRFSDVKVLVASYDSNGKLHQVAYNF